MNCIPSLHLLEKGGKEDSPPQKKKKELEQKEGKF